ncbi:amino acid ABC transporter permease [Actinoplanes palleronii]|uniref:Amino acid ABC transporter permease n=1 Tax=Actinoplanes palleronii TaxID=113570 RepID=A0ABQ4BNL1_9ACTN|nr:amino acid ABC transporter permease [Actinoplanes palleronii]GIE72264.1 amino acid ABC transporter permease [Actinoplanes palleronii]
MTSGDDYRILFDEPGPRARRTIRIVTAVSIVVGLVLAGLAVRQFAINGQLAADKWRMFTEWPYQRFLLTGLVKTLQAAAVCTVLALPLGALLALARLSGTRLLRWPATVFVELFRSVPALLLVYVFLLGLPRFGIVLPVFWQLVVPIVISGTATVAELFRAGVLSMERGQFEAAYSVGLTPGQAMRLIILPQVVRRLVPVLVTAVVSLLKDTTLGYVVSYSELLNSGRTLAQYTQALVQTYLVVAVLYIVVNGLLSRLAAHLEQRQRRRGTAPIRAEAVVTLVT